MNENGPWRLHRMTHSYSRFAESCNPVESCRVSSVHMTRLRDTLTQLLVAVLCVGIPFVLSNVALKWFPDGAGMAPLRNGFKIVVLVAAYLAYVQWVEKRSPFELSWAGALQEAGVGFLVGASVISVSVAVLAGLDAYHVDGINPLH